MALVSQSEAIVHQREALVPQGEALVPQTEVFLPPREVQSPDPFFHNFETHFPPGLPFFHGFPLDGIDIGRIVQSWSKRHYTTIQGPYTSSSTPFFICLDKCLEWSWCNMVRKSPGCLTTPPGSWPGKSYSPTAGNTTCTCTCTCSPFSRKEVADVVS